MLKIKFFYFSYIILEHPISFDILQYLLIRPIKSNQSEFMNLYLDNIGFAYPVVSMNNNNNNNKDIEKSHEDPTIDEEVEKKNSTYTILLGGHTSMWDCIGYLKYPHNIASGSMVCVHWLETAMSSQIM